MVCDGILPIDQMKADYMAPVRLLCERLPPAAFERCYAIKLRSDAERADDPDMPEIARELLVAHALAVRASPRLRASASPPHTG